MAFGRLRNRDVDNESSALVSSEADLAGAQTFLDEGCELVGQLRFRDPVRIDGRVEGEIHSESDVLIGQPGAVEASIRAGSVEVHGSVEGEIVADRKITLHKTARVIGDLQTAGIVIEEGASFRGCIVIGDGDRDADTLVATPASADAERSDSETLPG